MKFSIYLGLLCLLVSCVHASEPGKESEALDRKDGIHRYDSSDYDAVKAITRQHASALLQFFYEYKHGEKQFDREFKGLASDLKDNNAWVYVKDAKPVGFVTYGAWETLASRLFNMLFCPEPEFRVRAGAINALAIDKAHQKNGYGKQLVQHVLDDFERQSIHKVQVTTIKDVGEELAPFYRKFGFYHVRTAKYSDWANVYARKSGPNPWLGLLKKGLKLR